MEEYLLFNNVFDGDTIQPNSISEARSNTEQQEFSDAQETNLAQQELVQGSSLNEDPANISTAAYEQRIRNMGPPVTNIQAPQNIQLQHPQIMRSGEINDEENPPEVDTDPYFSWSTDEYQQIDKIEILKIFKEVQEIFGFQEDSAHNVYELLMTHLDSRTSRMSASRALLSVHADYIGGEHANYKKWYFCAMMEEDPELTEGINMKKFKNLKKEQKDVSEPDFHPSKKIHVVEYRWKERMYKLSPKDMIYQLSLYLMIWGEANNMRFAPELLCFLFKCALDYLEYSQKNDGEDKKFPKNDFLDRIITPLYEYYRDQQYKLIDGEYIRREKDHHQVIGYDDINQLFWYYETIKTLSLSKNKKEFLINLSIEKRYDRLGDVIWKNSFYKTYRERRSWWHLATNFSRIWIIHLNMFWYYSSFNAPTLYTYNYNYMLNNQPTLQARFSVVSLGSTVGCIVQILATIFEWVFVPRKFPGSKNLTIRLILLMIITMINFLPSVFVLGIIPLNTVSRAGLIVSIVQFSVSVLTTIWFSFQAPSNLFSFSSSNKMSGYDAMKVFTASYPKLDNSGRVISILLWLLVFGAKFVESYFFLTLSLRDPIRNLNIIDLSRCYGDMWIANSLCQYQSVFVLVLMFLTDLVLFFLDTYLWYIIWNCVISLSLSFSSGISILSPWRNVFIRLPSRIYSKLLATSTMEIKYKPIYMISQIWNAIIISMYREHLLSQDHVHRLIYAQLPKDSDGSITLKPPSFFVFQDDSSRKMSDFFIPNSEAERRISFFAQSMSTTIIEPIPVEAMPTFTVFIPHYSEKILLELKEIIKQDPSSKLSLLEYLKMMFPHEWQYFVTDTKMMVRNSNAASNNENESMGKDDVAKSEEEFVDTKINDLPLYCIGYKSSSPEYTMRTRIWASLRTQTLYRTVSGFMNYNRAIKLMHRIENPEMLRYFSGEEVSETYLDVMAARKFRLLISMQKMQDFTKEEKANVQVLINSYPEIYISCLEKEKNAIDDSINYYAVLYEVEKSDKPPGNKFAMKYKIKLSGNPILGDGKSDNQNMSIIFYRGEYIQVIDANQDNYLEECLKIRSVLAEFESLELDPENPYIPSVPNTDKNPVAILGAREYIFSENTGVLGDVAASKEQTFGTMFARTLSEIGGKLHYGHPDFLNGIFMTTRGGISKAQKGLHLNEDIYAGMNAICRGGKIKHCDYYQCGKGRDLGFSSILNFTTKIGGGMGEQLLSREYYYLGTQMPLDRFLSFYYAHPGFHINNLFIMFSLQIFMLTVVNLGAMNHELILCIYDKDVPITDLQIPLGCQNLQPVLDWVSRYVLSIFICFFISFIPLVLHELSERGMWKACSRLFMHFLSLSPFFEVFACQIYSNSLKNDIVFGGARYISTGRGFSITRIPFIKLYSSYAPTSIYSGARLLLLLLFTTITMWQPAILWFWITLFSLCFSPFIFNPHQFSWIDFFLDYREFIRWMSRGNSKWHKSSWITFTRFTRSRFTGFKREKLAKCKDGEKIKEHYQRAPFMNTLFAEVFVPIVQAFFISMAYMFINSQTGVKDPQDVNILARLIIVTFAPIILNIIILICIFPLSCFAGPLLSLCSKKSPSVLAAVAHLGSVFIHVIIFELTWVLEGFNFCRTLGLFTSSVFIQRILFQATKLLLLTREMKEDQSNRAWWSGKWIGLGKFALTQPLREFTVKISEMSLFAADFFIGHGIMIVLTPILFLPYVDHWHSCMMMWIKPSRYLRGPIYTISQDKLRTKEATKYAILYFSILIFFALILITPVLIGLEFRDSIKSFIPENGYGLIQPDHQNNNDTGSRAPKSIIRTRPRDVQYSTYWI